MHRPPKLPFDLLLIIIWTIITFVFIITPSLSQTFIKTILVIPMVLFIPGYVLISALYPKKHDLDNIERLALSSGLSIAITPVLGIVLKFTLGAELVDMLLALCLLTIILIIFAVYRRNKQPPEERFYVPFHRLQELVEEDLAMPKSKTERISTGILIFTIVLAVSMLYFVITTPKIGEHFTEFYILGPEGKADNYPTTLQSNYPATILVGVANHEYISVNYTVRIALDKEILTDTLFSSGHNEIWEKNVTFVPEKNGTNMKLEFWLFKEDNFSSPYRELYMWVN
ncbi:MAG: DUF1616 domain-containing protein, partial [Candidatus Methanoperedens sp.]|nr:DUF1616 domain-containing protein [Candidatus Methanoperedens sp.]